MKCAGSIIRLLFFPLRFERKNSVGPMNSEMLFFLTKRVASAFCLKHRCNLITKRPLQQTRKSQEKEKEKNLNSKG
jgi:hypothetical protein